MCVLCACMRACGGGVASVPLLAEVFQGLLGSLAVFHAALRGERSPPPGDEARGGNWFQMKQEVWRGRQREGCLRLREEDGVVDGVKCGATVKEDEDGEEARVSREEYVICDFQ